MTKDEMTAEIELVCRMAEKANRVFDDLNDLLGCALDAPVWACLFESQGSLIKQTERLIGDDAGWLRWFIYSNDCGRKGLVAQCAGWKKPRSIRTASQLATLICGEAKVSS